MRLARIIAVPAYFAAFACSAPIDYRDGSGAKISDLPSTALSFATTDPSESLLIAWSSVAAGASEVPLDTSIVIKFNHPLDASSVTQDSLRVVSVDTGAVVPGKIKFDGDLLEIDIDERFFIGVSSKGEPETQYTGLHANTLYRIEIDSQIRSTSGLVFGKTPGLLFSTVSNEYGFYWLGAGGEYEKARAERQSKLFDNTRPTVIFVHGWERNTTANNLQRDIPFLYSNRFFGKANVIPLWKNKGYNVGVFQWAQWADEEDVKDAEIKVLNPQANHRAKDGGFSGMRYKLRNGKYKDWPIDRSIARIFVDEYSKLMTEYGGAEVRLLGHSLGSQIVGQSLDLLAKAVDEGKMREEAFPKRIALLDPFWSKGEKEYIDGKSPAALFTEQLRTILDSKEIAVEYYKSSLLGGIVGDLNAETRKIAAFSRIWASFIPVSDGAAQHFYSYIWYLNSINSPWASSADWIGAGVSNTEVIKKMNIAANNEQHFSQYYGSDTVTPHDDKFKLVDGVNPK